MVQEIYVRKAGVAGKFYAANKTTLEREIAMYLENSLAKPHFAPIKALIAPHAGYMYSGGVAARAYRQVLNEKVSNSRCSGALASRIIRRNFYFFRSCL